MIECRSVSFQNTQKRVIKMKQVLIAFLSLCAYHSFAFDRNQVGQDLQYAVQISAPVYQLHVQNVLNQCANDIAVWIQQAVPSVLGYTDQSASIIGNFRAEIFNLASNDMRAIRYIPSVDADYIQSQCALFQTFGVSITQMCQSIVASSVSYAAESPADYYADASAAYSTPFQVMGFLQPVE